MGYHNTTDLEGEELKDSTKKAESQTEKVLAYFKRPYVDSASPSEVYSALLLGCPLTSIRRSISDLTKDGELEKTEKKREGKYGKPEYAWKLKFNPTLF